ncbi:preprotein translocase subunit SecA [compost metagenome]
MQFKHEEVSALQQPEEPEQGEHVAEIAPMPVRTEPKIGRNELCPCGSGKKYKHCHGQVQ